MTPDIFEPTPEERALEDAVQNSLPECRQFSHCTRADPENSMADYEVTGLEAARQCLDNQMSAYELAQQQKPEPAAPAEQSPKMQQTNPAQPGPDGNAPDLSKGPSIT